MKFNQSIFSALLLCLLVNVSNAQNKNQSSDQQVKRDQIRITVQQICPISGTKLGDHGSPVKVKVGEEHVFVCCKQCLKKKIDTNHWATIHGNFAKAQKICPVMKHKLPKKPKWTIIKGQIVYVCCPPCTKKIEAKPESYLTKMDELYSASLKAAKKR